MSLFKQTNGRCHEMKQTSQRCSWSRGAVGHALHAPWTCRSRIRLSQRIRHLFCIYVQRTDVSMCFNVRLRSGGVHWGKRATNVFQCVSYCLDFAVEAGWLQLVFLYCLYTSVTEHVVIWPWTIHIVLVKKENIHSSQNTVCDNQTFQRQMFSSQSVLVL